MAQEGYCIYNYIDDHVIIGHRSDCEKAFKRLTQLLPELGLTISEHKNILPSKRVVCLGILIDSDTFTMEIPHKKFMEIKKFIEEWSCKKKCSKTQLQSLLDSLLYITKCVRYARSFLNRLLQLLRENHAQKFITLTEEANRDIKWFKKFLPIFNGKSFFVKRYFHHEIQLDACLTGIGAVCKNEIYAQKFPENFKDMHISCLEMMNILVAIRVWATAWAGKNVEIHCDNASVVSVLIFGKTKDPDLATISRNIFMLCSKFDIYFHISHIEGKRMLLLTFCPDGKIRTHRKGNYIPT